MYVNPSQHTEPLVLQRRRCPVDGLGLRGLELDFHRHGSLHAWSFPLIHSARLEPEGPNICRELGQGRIPATLRETLLSQIA